MGKPYQNYQTNYRGLILAFLILYVASPIFAANIGILPGSFDPIHRGHIAVAKNALNKLNLDAVYLIPNGINPRKPQMTEVTKRAEIIEATLKDLGAERIKLFPVEKIILPATSGPLDEAPVRLLDMAKETFAKDCVWQILGADSVNKVLKSSGISRINPKWKLAVSKRPGIEIEKGPEFKKLEKKNLLATFDNSFEFNISSSAIRKACKTGNLKLVKKLMSPSAYKKLIKQGGYQSNLHSSWLEEILKLNGDKLVPNAEPTYGPIVVNKEYKKLAGQPQYQITYKTPLKEVLDIDFNGAHSIHNVHEYLSKRVTPIGMKVLANPDVEVSVFAGTQEQLSHYLASNGICKGIRLTRDRDFVTSGVNLVKTPAGKYLAIIDEVYGMDRMRQTQAFVAFALHLGGRDKSDFRIIYEANGAFGRNMEQIFSDALKPVIPNTIDAAIIGYQWTIKKELSHRMTLFQKTGSTGAVSCGKIANNWVARRKSLNSKVELSSWPEKMYFNRNFPFSFLTFSNDQGKKINVLSTRNVYGDQLQHLLKVLIHEKKIKKIIVFGNAGGLFKGVSVGDIILPVEAKRFDTEWLPIKNSLLNNKSLVQNLTVGKIYSVFSPLVETNQFIKDLAQNNVSAIEVETGYLTANYVPKNVQLGSVIIISDVPGSSETISSLKKNEKKMGGSVTFCVDLILKHLGLNQPGTHSLPIRQ